MLRFMCTNCLQYVNNVDDILKDMQMVVKKNGQHLAEYKSEFDSALKKHESEIKQVLKAVEVEFSERIKAMQKAQDTCEKSVKEVNKIREIAECFKRNSEQVCDEIKNNKNDNKKMIEAISKENKKMCTEIKKNVNTEAKVSYAAVTKTGKLSKTKEALPDVRKVLPIIITPSSKQDAKITKNDLNSKVDPKDLQITKIKTRQSGVVIVESANVQEREKIKTAIVNNIGNNYEVKIPKKVKPEIIVTGINFKYDDDELIQRIRRQNNCVNETEIKMVKQYEVKKGDKIFYNAILEVDIEAFAKILAEERLNVGWDRCRIYDAVQVLCCFKCKGFNHKAIDCKEKEVCTKCLGEHKYAVCNEDAINKCINCMRTNKELNLGLDENHDSLDRNCPVYQQKLAAKKRKIGY